MVFSDVDINDFKTILLEKLDKLGSNMRDFSVIVTKSSVLARSESV